MTFWTLKIALHSRMAERERAVVELGREIKVETAHRHIKREWRRFGKDLDCRDIKLNVAILLSRLHILFWALVDDASNSDGVFIANFFCDFYRSARGEHDPLHLPERSRKSKTPSFPWSRRTSTQPLIETVSPTCFHNSPISIRSIFLLCHTNRFANLLHFLLTHRGLHAFRSQHFFHDTGIFFQLFILRPHWRKGSGRGLQ